MYTDQKCGRGLAPSHSWLHVKSGLEEAQGVSLQVVIQQAKPAYCAGTGVRRSKCGRGLAPDGGLSAKTCMTDPPLSGASPLPQLVVFQVGVRRSPGGWSAGSDPTGKALLLCQNGCTPIKIWEGASPLPHWVVFQVGVRRVPGGWSAGSGPTGKALLLCRNGCTPIKMWEGACPRWQCVSQYIPD